MLYLFVILIIELFFCVFEYIHAKAVFVNPTFLSFLVLTISTLLGFIGNMYWGVQISPTLIVVVFLGFLAMMAADITANITTAKYCYHEKAIQAEVRIHKLRENVVLFVVFICTVLYCYDILKAGAAMGYGGSSAIYAVKRDNSGTNVLIRQGVKIVMAAMFVHTFIFVNNVLVVGKKGLRHYKHLIPAMCAILCCVFTSVRTEIFRVIAALMANLCVLLFQKKKWNVSSLNKFVKKVIPYILIGVILLVGVRFIVKGKENATSNSYGVLMYAAYYLGTPIVVLGSKLSEGIELFRGNLFGETTFNRFYDFLRGFGLFSNVEFQEGSINVWIDEAKGITANVDTIFGPPTIDFGVLGMVIYIFILFFILNHFYYRYIYRSFSSNKRNSKLIIYSFYASIPAMAFYTNYLNQFLTVYFLLTYVLIVLIGRFYGIFPPFLKRKSQE